ncbi:hypothetical protein CIPAW_06G086200 [Carya illinoinensis]|uniref:Uncharacterized protein n=1 Tax=Carya illinoinensis TaxID=32201 RepID=A0A8T1Q9P0_CARIL|nr:hypothetical protein CIPAW_06G086200 [Carya illinoinensis]
MEYIKGRKWLQVQQLVKEKACHRGRIVQARRSRCLLQKNSLLHINWTHHLTQRHRFRPTECLAVRWKHLKTNHCFLIPLIKLLTITQEIWRLI